MEFHEIIFWHADPTGMVLWNAKLREGWMMSASMMARGDGNQDITTPYAALHANREKEAVWEQIRLSEFPDRPSRMKSMFLFVSKSDADKAMQTWFLGEDRDLLALQIPKTSNLHIGDTKHLDTTPDQWETASRLYWSSQFSDEPFLEAILDGTAYVHNWTTLETRLR